MSYIIKLNAQNRTISLRRVQRNIQLRQTGRHGLPGKGFPAGGETGEVLAKASDTDFDTEWILPPTAPVTSVNGQTGAVVLDAEDVGAVDSVIAGTNITITGTATNPIINADGGGDVESVNGQTGVVVLDQDDIPDGATYKQYSATEKTKLAGIEAGADVTDATNVAAAGAFMKSTDDTDDITVGATNKFATAAEKATIGNITVTQPVDLDTMESDIANKQPLDSDLTTIASLTATTDNFMVATASAWASRTPTQARTQMGLGTIATLSTISLTTNVTGILPGANGGTGNGFFAVTGPTTALRTFTFPNASATVLTSSNVVTVAQGGTGRATSTTPYGLLAAGTGATTAHQTLATGLSGQILKSNGASALPTFQTGAPADVALGNVDNTSDATKNAAVATLTNKTIQPRIVSITSSATPAFSIDNLDVAKVTALATNITSMTSSLTGTPYDGQKIIWYFLDNGTARTIAWGASFEACGAALPTTTVLGKRLRVFTIYDSATSKHGCVSTSQEV